MSVLALLITGLLSGFELRNAYFAIHFHYYLIVSLLIAIILSSIMIYFNVFS
jgi:hypothetical protein